MNQKLYSRFEIQIPKIFKFKDSSKSILNFTYKIQNCEHTNLIPRKLHHWVCEEQIYQQKWANDERIVSNCLIFFEHRVVATNSRHGWVFTEQCSNCIAIENQYGKKWHTNHQNHSELFLWQIGGPKWCYCSLWVPFFMSPIEKNLCFEPLNRF